MVAYRVTFMVRTPGGGPPTVVREGDFTEHAKAVDAGMAWQNLVAAGGHVFEVALVDIPDV